jgi:hypothetical protein
MWSPTQIESNPTCSAARAMAAYSGQRTSRSTSGQLDSDPKWAQGSSSSGSSQVSRGVDTESARKTAAKFVRTAIPTRSQRRRSRKRDGGAGRRSKTRARGRAQLGIAQSCPEPARHGGVSAAIAAPASQPNTARSTLRPSLMLTAWSLSEPFGDGRPGDPPRYGHWRVHDVVGRGSLPDSCRRRERSPCAQTQRQRHSRSARAVG